MMVKNQKNLFVEVLQNSKRICIQNTNEGAFLTSNIFGFNKKIYPYPLQSKLSGTHIKKILSWKIPELPTYKILFLGMQN